jgi:hypothetical protein
MIVHSGTTYDEPSEIAIIAKIAGIARIEKPAIGN